MRDPYQSHNMAPVNQSQVADDGARNMTEAERAAQMGDGLRNVHRPTTTPWLLAAQAERERKHQEYVDWRVAVAPSSGRWRLVAWCLGWALLGAYLGWMTS